MPLTRYRWKGGSHYYRGLKYRPQPFRHYWVPEQMVHLLVDPKKPATGIRQQITDMLQRSLCLNPMTCNISRDITVEVSEEEIVAYSTSDLDGQGFIIKWIAAS